MIFNYWRNNKTNCNFWNFQLLTFRTVNWQAKVILNHFLSKKECCRMELLPRKFELIKTWKHVFEHQEWSSLTASLHNFDLSVFRSSGAKCSIMLSGCHLYKRISGWRLDWKNSHRGSDEIVVFYPRKINTNCQLKMVDWTLEFRFVSGIFSLVFLMEEIKQVIMKNHE